MIEYGVGSIFDSGAEVIVNPVNTCGIMGSGLARAFRERFPTNNSLYVLDCSKGKLAIGRVTIHSDGEFFIANLATKDKYWNDSELSYVDLGMSDLVQQLKSKGFHSVAIPALGCGLGKLNWKDVEPIIRKHLDQVPEIHAIIYPPQ